MHQLLVHQHVMRQLLVLGRVQTFHVDVTWLVAKLKALPKAIPLVIHESDCVGQANWFGFGFQGAGCWGHLPRLRIRALFPLGGAAVSRPVASPATVVAVAWAAFPSSVMAARRASGSKGLTRLVLLLSLSLPLLIPPTPVFPAVGLLTNVPYECVCVHGVGAAAGCEKP
jgi:hypothetical protein